jgi:hypothetical protein
VPLKGKSLWDEYFLVQREGSVLKAFFVMPCNECLPLGASEALLASVDLGGVRVLSGVPSGEPGGHDKEYSYLVDPASSHMLVSKIKPCMSKYKQVCTVKLRMAH